MTKPTLPHSLRFANGCELELLSSGDRWLGIGNVRIDDLPMRDAGKPLLPEIRNPEGIELCDWRVVGQAPLPEGGLAIELEPHRREGGPMEWMLHRIHNRYRVSDWSAAPQPAPDTRLAIELRPAAREVRGERGHGFSYSFRYVSKSIPIYRILDRGTWEPGGTALGLEFWLRQSFAPSIHRFADPAEHYTTEWWLPGCRNPSIFQFLPFQTQFPGFTLTTAPQGALVTWVDGVAHVRSLFEKPRGTTSLLHLHEHCGDLAYEFDTRPVEVLWFPGQRGHTGNANLWESLREWVGERLHAELGMRQDRIAPYCTVEEWGLPDFDLYTREAVPALLAHGIRQVYIPNEFENNMNTWGVGNMCCTVDYKLAETVGEEKVKRFCDAVHAGGATVHHWANTALSSYTYLNSLGCGSGSQGRLRKLPVEGSITEVIENQPQAFVRNAAGHIEADHYGHVFCQLNLRDPAVVAYWHRRWREAREKVGFDGIFLDSSFNLSSDKFDWIGEVAGSGGATIDQTQLLGNVRPEVEPPKAILSQYRAHLELVVEMQRYGYHYNSEDCGVFGSHRTGPDVAKRLDNLFMWREFVAVWDGVALRAAGVDPQDIFFRGLAYRCVWMLFWHIPTRTLSWRESGVKDELDRPTAEQGAWMQAFNAADADMLRRTILPDEAGVVYDGGQRRILWAFRDLELPVAVGACATDLVGDTPTVIANGRLHALARHVYGIGGQEPT
jgi:hypothetical protein